MTLPAYALVTRSEVKAYKPMSGTGLDGLIDEEIGRWSLELESYLDRRIVARYPTEDDDSILTATAWANSTPAASGQPNSAGRTLVVTFPSTATAGVLTVTGTVGGVAGTTEAFDASLGCSALHGVKFFTAVSAIAITGAIGTGNVKVGTSLGYQEYHTPYVGTLDLWPLEWPVRQVLEVNEDTTRAYASATQLASGTDYLLADRERLTRISSGDRSTWDSGWRAVKHVYSAGYFTPANVPGALKLVALELIAWSIAYGQRQLQGQSSHSDATGSMSFVGPPMITTGMRARLANFRNRRIGVVEREIDLEAA